MAYFIIKTYIFLALIVALPPIFGLSVLTGSDSQNTTYPEETVREVKNFDVLRELLNQETIIRMRMTKDMLSLKQSLVGEVSTLKQTTIELKKELHHLERENERLSKESAECKENTRAIHETEKNTSNIIGDMKIEVRYLSVTLLNLNEKVKTDNENIPKFFVDKYSLISAERNKSLVDYQTNLTATAGWCVD